MERNKLFKAYIVDTEEVMTVYYAGSTGHDMIDYFKDGYGNHYRMCYDNIKNAPKNLLTLKLFYIYDGDSRRKKYLQKCEDALQKNMTFSLFLAKYLLQTCSDKELYVLERKFLKMKEEK
jgi:predicted ATP-dependent endonuclease of OLD family